MRVKKIWQAIIPVLIIGLILTFIPLAQADQTATRETIFRQGASRSPNIMQSGAVMYCMSATDTIIGTDSIEITVPVEHVLGYFRVAVKYTTMNGSLDSSTTAYNYVDFGASSASALTAIDDLTDLNFADGSAYTSTITPAVTDTLVFFLWHSDASIAADDCTKIEFELITQ